MRPAIKELFDKTTNKQVFLVGGGSSLVGFDYSRLYDKVTVAINSSFEKLPNATMLYWCDSPWAAKNHDSLEEHQCKLRFTATFHATDDQLNNKTTICGANYLRRMMGPGFDTNIDNVKGSNSGAHCINLIANMKPSRIILLGFDMRHLNGKSHWHSYNPTPVVSEIYEDDFIPSIESMVPTLKTLGVEVINCSPHSALRCFPKANVTDYLDNE